MSNFHPTTTPPNPQTTPAPGAGGLNSLFPPGYTSGFGPGGTSIVQAGMKLGINPQLAQAPGIQGDDIYEAALAQARFQANQEYQNLLRELGFLTQDGSFIPGLIETEAVRKRAELARGLENVTDQVNENAVRQGSFFSGRRAELLAKGQQPFTSGMAQLEGDTMQQLMDRYNSVAGLLSGFGISQQQLAAELAERRKQAAWQQQYLDLLSQQGSDGYYGGGMPPGGNPNTDQWGVPKSISWAPGVDLWNQGTPGWGGGLAKKIKGSFF